MTGSILGTAMTSVDGDLSLKTELLLGLSDNDSWKDFSSGEKQKAVFESWQLVPHSETTPLDQSIFGL